jgi:hypothetical protein
MFFFVHLSLLSISRCMMQNRWVRCMQWVDFSAPSAPKRFLLFGFTFCTSRHSGSTAQCNLHEIP